MKQKTALKQFIKWGDEMLKKNPHTILSFAEAIDKAQEFLEKEKEQIINAWMAEDNELQRLAAEHYYKETYGNS